MFNFTALHQFWFDDIELSHAYYQRKVPLWFLGPHPEFYQNCTERFAPWLDQISADQAKSKDLTASEYVAKVILFDQIPRNAFRGTTKAYAFDSIARTLCLDALDSSLENDLSYPEKLFLYLPLEHAEDLYLQNLCVEKFTALHENAPPQLKTWTQLALDKAHEHRNTVREHGCFPLRAKTAAHANAQ